MSKNSSVTVAFDVDGTLITHGDEPRQHIVDFYRAFQKMGCRMVVWSGGGFEYAKYWAEKLDLKPDIILSKYSQENEVIVPDIIIDDEAGYVNGKVGIWA